MPGAAQRSPGFALAAHLSRRPRTTRLRRRRPSSHPPRLCEDMASARWLRRTWGDGRAAAAWLLLALSVVAALAAFGSGVAGLAADRLLGLIALALGLYLGGAALVALSAD